MSITAMALVFMGCPTDPDDPPPAVSTDEEYTNKLVYPAGTTNTNLPPVSYWNELGEIVYWPDPFMKYDGTRLQDTGSAEGNLAAWLQHRAQIKAVMEYYYTGKQIPQPTSVVLKDYPASPVIGGANPITITVTANNKSVDYSFTINIPANGPNGLPPSGNNRIPIMFATTATYRDNGYATVNHGVSSDSLTGWIQDLFEFNNAGDMDRPFAHLRTAWAISRIMDAIELLNDLPGGYPVDSAKGLTTGNSRGGKQAMYGGVFAESLRGTHIAVTGPSSSGTGGTAPERFVSEAGGKREYYKKGIDTLTPPLALYGSTYDVYAGDAPDYILAERPSAGQNNGGFQTHPHARLEQAGWVSNRLHEFTEMYNYWVCNYQTATNPNPETGRPHGIIGQMPLDAHFGIILAAPYGFATWDGIASHWTVPEGTYLAMLAAKEVYDYIGKSENIGFRIYDVRHSQPARAHNDLVDFANIYFNNNFTLAQRGGTAYVRQVAGDFPIITDINVFQDKDPAYGSDPRMPDGKRRLFDWFDINAVDPFIRHDYYKVNWASPTKSSDESIGAIVRKYHLDNGIEAGPDGDMREYVNFTYSLPRGGAYTLGTTMPEPWPWDISQRDE